MRLTDKETQFLIETLTAIKNGKRRKISASNYSMSFSLMDILELTKKLKGGE